MKQRKQAFTLIELIVVMGIVGILAAGGLAAFTLTAKSGRVDQAREIVSTAVRSARSYAVSNNRNVLLVFNTNQSLHSKRDERCNRAMAVYDPIEKDYVTDWMNIPAGVFIDSGFGLMTSTKQIAYEGGNVQMPWIWIKSDGTLPRPNGDYELRIEEGIPGVDTSSVYTPHPQARWKKIRINWLNGSIATFEASSVGDLD